MSADDPGLLRAEVPRALAGQRLDRVLARLFEGFTGAQLQRLARGGKVKLDGAKVYRTNVRVRGGERLSLRVAPPPSPYDRSAPLAWLAEEAGYAVVDKPPGMLVHATEKQHGGTVADLAVERYGRLPSVEGDARPGIVHRLDRETSGVMVLARTRDAMRELRAQFRERRVTKRYLALVHDVPEDDEFAVDLALGPVPGDLDRQRPDRDGKPAFTRFEVVRRLERHALVVCHPETGRRHQLRVHLAAAGHSIVGDKLYRPPRGSEPVRGVWHHMLHAAALEFDEPGGARRVRFEAEPPASFAELLDALSRP
ncbi:MAG: RluA family pseudouridine synthase [Planctomycetes bacterium]|nr:RluA family pseudouridine synthase [Planctomycetota bacterium]